MMTKVLEFPTMTTRTLHIFIKHTLASFTIYNHVYTTVPLHFDSNTNKTIPENAPYYKHNYEGSDDMPVHIKASLLGNSVQIPISNGKLNLGIWQGIYLGEHRNNVSGRRLVIILFGN